MRTIYTATSKLHCVCESSEDEQALRKKYEHVTGLEIKAQPRHEWLLDQLPEELRAPVGMLARTWGSNEEEAEGFIEGIVESLCAPLEELAARAVRNAELVASQRAH